MVAPTEWDNSGMRHGDPSARATVLERAFALLGAFDADSPDLTLEQLCRRTGLTRSTAYRLATQLTRQGALARSAHGWRLGTQMFELGQLVPREQELRELALAHMQDLYAATRETVQLAVIDASQVLYVEIISGHRKVPTPSRRGGRMPLHCTALGKVLLAFSSDAGRSYLAGRRELESRTPNTIRDRDELRRALHEVRRLQVAYDDEEAAVGLRCVAAPILDQHGVAVAGLSVSMPANGSLTLAEATPAVQIVARALGRTLRARPTSTLWLGAKAEVAPPG